MSFTFYNSIPASGNSPSVDQPKMLQNNIATANLIDVDHIGFNQTPGGKHRQTRLQKLTVLPVGVANEGMVYTKTATSTGVLTETDLFYRPDATTDEYQMTRTITASKALFGANAPYGTPPAGFTQEGGWTFLPGGMLFQYGFFGKVGALGSSNTIQYPVRFTNIPYAVNLTLYRNSGQAVSVDNGGFFSTTSFVFNAATSGSDGVFWTAIGV